MPPMSWNRFFQLVCNTSTKSGSPLRASVTDNTVVDSVIWVSRDTFPLRLYFVQDTGLQNAPLTCVRLNTGDQIKVIGNSTSDLESDPSLYAATAFSETQDPDGNYYYEAVLDLNTEPGNTAVDALAGQLSLPCIFDVVIESADNSQRRRFQVKATISKPVDVGQSAPVAAQNLAALGIVRTIVAGSGVAVNSTNPANPVVSVISIPPTILTPSSACVIPVPSGTPSAGDRSKFYVTPSGNQTLTVASGIRIPSDSTFNNSVGKTLTSGLLYLVQLEYSGSFWMLTVIEGGF